MNRSRVSSSGATLVVPPTPRRPDNGDGVVVSFDSEESSSDDEVDRSSEEDDARSTTSSSAHDESDDDSSTEEEQERKVPKDVKLLSSINTSSSVHDEDDESDGSENNEHEHIGYKVTLEPAADSDVTDNEEISDTESPSFVDKTQKEVVKKFDTDEDDSVVEEKHGQTQTKVSDTQPVASEDVANNLKTASIGNGSVAPSNIETKAMTPDSLEKQGHITSSASDEVATSPESAKIIQNEESHEVHKNSLDAQGHGEPVEDLTKKITSKSGKRKKNVEKCHEREEEECAEEAKQSNGCLSPSNSAVSERSNLVKTPDLLTNGVSKLRDKQEPRDSDDDIEEPNKNAAVDLLNADFTTCTSVTSELQPEVNEDKKQSNDVQEKAAAGNVDEQSNSERPVVIDSLITQPFDSNPPLSVETPKVEEVKDVQKKKKKKKTSDRSVSEEKTASGDRVNEDSSLTEGRRNSIDDFIKRILAEAREEQKRRMNDTQNPATTELPGTAGSKKTQEDQEQTQMDVPVIEKEKTPPKHQEQPSSSASLNDSDSALTTDFIRRDGTASVTPDSTNLFDISANRLTPVKSPTSMLDRRLASTERKREQEKTSDPLSADTVEDSLIVSLASTKQSVSSPITTEEKATDLCPVPAKSRPYSSGVSEEIDRELAELGKIFAKRTPLNVDNGSADDDTALMEAENGWLKSRSKVGRQTDWSNFSAVEGIEDEEGISSDRQFLSGRRLSSQFGLSGLEEFTPSRRPETDEIIRDRLRPVKTIIEQQTDVIQKLKSVGREVSQLDDEINSLRQRCLVERKMAVDTMFSAVAEEMRLYESEQQAAEERISRQLLIVHFVREQFVAASMSNITAGMRTGSGLFDRRANIENSLSSRVVPVSGLRSMELPSHSRRAQSVAPNSVADDIFDSRRTQRAGSMARDVTSNGGDDLLRRRSMTSNGIGQRFSTSGSELSVSDANESIRRSRMLRAGSVGPGLYSASALRESSDSDRHRLTSNSHSVVDAYSTSGDDVSSSRRYSQYRGGSDYSSASMEPSDNCRPNSYSSSRSSLGDSSSGDTSSSLYTRRYSTTDLTSYRYPSHSSTYAGSNGVSSASSGYSARSNDGEFRSKFLDKVRERKAKASMESDYTSTSTYSPSSYSSSKNDDKSFKSRFLKPSSDADSHQ